MLRNWYSESWGADTQGKLILRGFDQALSEQSQVGGLIGRGRPRLGSGGGLTRQRGRGWAEGGEDGGWAALAGDAHQGGLL